MKKQQLVQIPVGYVCISAHEYGSMRNGLSLNASQIDDLREQIGELQKHITEQAVKLATSEAKAAGLEKEVSQKQDRVMYWYNECEKLQKQIAAVKPNAETKEA